MQITHRFTGILMLLIFGRIELACATDYLNMNLDELLHVPVYGSTLRDESQQNVPAAVTVFSRTQLNALGFDYLHELLDLVPGYQSSRGADNPINFMYSARGRRNGTASREVLVLVDGNELSDPRSRSMDNSFKMFPLAMIEKVEIIRGPGSAIYGSNAFTGVINITTRQHAKEFSMQVGDNNRVGAMISWFTQAENWEASIRGDFFTTDGQNYTLPNSFSGADYQTQDPHQAGNINATLAIDNWRVTLLHHQAKADDFYSFENTENNINKYNETFTDLNLQYKWQPWSRMNSTIKLSYTKSQSVGWLVILPEGALSALSNPGSLDAMYANPIVNSYRIGLLQTNNITLNELSSFQLGFDLRHTKEVEARAYSNYDLSELASRQFPISFYNNFAHFDFLSSESTQNSAGFYTQYLRDLSNSLHLTLGARIDSFNDFGEHLSPRFAVVKNLNDSQSLKLLYGEAFRTPSLTETGLINNPVIVGNKNLNYETVKTWDLIWTGAWKQTSITLGVYSNRYESPIVAGFIGNTRTYVNARTQSVNGFETEWLQQLNDQWQFRASYTDLGLTENSFRESGKLASSSLQYTSQNWSWNLAAIYHSAPHSLNRQSEYLLLDSYLMINTKLCYQINASYDVSLQVKNLLDENYTTPAQGNGIPQGVPHPGREWSLELNWRY